MERNHLFGLQGKGRTNKKSLATLSGDKAFEFALPCQRCHEGHGWRVALQALRTRS